MSYDPVVFSGVSGNTLLLLRQSSSKVKVRRKVRCHREAVDFLALTRRSKPQAVGSIDSHPPKTAASGAAIFVAALAG
jgi:hypothetical protein